jgi:uncharacterized 2Fe-2S/4Fe-4S cluster protein (DUF4445 family)
MKAIGQRITVTQNDVRAIQLAKAALYAGVKLLMEKQASSMSIRIRFAGAFGSFIDPKYAMVLGLIPIATSTRSRRSATPPAPARLMALLNRDHRREIEQTVSKIEKIETALEPKASRSISIYAMALPNKVDARAHSRSCRWHHP